MRRLGWSDTDWVLAQTLDRKRRELEAEELEYAERLEKARRKEEALKKAARARVRKKLVSRPCMLPRVY